MKLKLLLLIFILSSCSHMMRSGRYVQIKEKTNLKRLSSKLNVPEWSLKLSNPNSSFRKGDWIFIPEKGGVLSKMFGNQEVEAQIYLSSSGFLWPIPGRKKISSGYGKRWGRQHEGIDIPARKGTSILAAMGGEVVYSGSGIGGYGNLIVISHKNAIFTVYAHNNKNFVSAGDRVVRGQVIGTVGETGRATGPHLHFEIRNNSRPIDPKRVYAFN